MNMFDDFKQAITDQKSKVNILKWEGNALDYLEKVYKHPEIANFSPARIYNAIMKKGTSDVPEMFKTTGYEDLVSYDFFHKNGIYGAYETVHDIMKFLKAASRRTETGKRILVLVGPVASGKSTIASMIKRGLEKDDTPKFAIKGCPLHEEPLHLIPEENREYWEDKLGVAIEGNLCPVCQQMIDNDYTDEKGAVRWEDVPVEVTRFSEQKRVGIGTFQPSDPKSQDITELIGRVNMTKLAMYTETDARAFDFSGELQVANGGMIEYIEILKADIKFHYVLISAAQEQVIKSPGFPQIYIDTLILSHTNQTEFDKFKSNRDNEALHDRMYKINAPWNLRVDDEIEIYKQMIDKSNFRGIHLAPHTLRIAAEFAVLSRLKPTKRVSSLIEKMKLYNGEISEKFNKEDIDVRDLVMEGRKNGEGMDGISPRFIINALDIALGKKEDKKCINPIDLIRALRDNFSHHIGITEEDETKYITMLTGTKDSISAEYKEIAKKEVNMAFLYAYEEQANELFNRYMKNVQSYCKKDKIKDSITGEYSNPDEQIMRAIEEHIGIPEQAKKEFRNGIFVYEADFLREGKPFTFKDYDPIREAIEKKLMGDLKNVVSLTLADSSSTDPKSSRRRDKALQTLEKKGYCPECARVLLTFIGEVLRREK